MAEARTPQPIDRASIDDLMSLATDRGVTPMNVGAVLFLDTRKGLNQEEAMESLARRVNAIPRLRRRLVDVPFGCGRPVWVDDDTFSFSHHLTTVRCSEPRGEVAVFEVAAALLATPLPRSRPLWAATLVTDTAEHEAALILVFHHVLADGMGGLSILADLSDETLASSAFPRPMPSVRQLVANVWAERRRAIRRLPAGLRRVGNAMTELRAATGSRLAATSLNRPTGRKRRFVSIRIDLACLIAAGHTYHGTVNDILLTAIGGALHQIMDARGEAVDEFIISVPFSARHKSAAGQLGNQSGVIPLAIPGVGDPRRRLAVVAETTRAAKLAPPGDSTSLLGPFFRLLARLGLFQYFVEHQRMIHTFVTNLRGPPERLEVLGFPVTSIMPLSVNTGNITVSFSALSYAGSLTVTIAADPNTCPDLDLLQRALIEQLTALMAGGGTFGTGMWHPSQQA